MTRSETTAFNLCNATWKAAIERFDAPAKINAGDFTPRERTVVLVWTVYGIVGNGGFEYLFSSNLPGDPGYRMALAAFRTVGCQVASQVFTDALAFFPGSTVPRGFARRKAVYARHSEEERAVIDRRFYAAEGEILTRLADYIRGGRTIGSNRTAASHRAS